MAEKYSLAAQGRDASVKQSARETRAERRVPGVVYGKGFDSESVSVAYSDLLRLYRKAGTSALVEIDLDGKSIPVLIHRLDLHPSRQEIQHVDFYAVNLKEKTMVEVPFAFVGESLAVKNQGGIFMQDHNSISIRCLPTEIPAEITIDISVLENIHDHINVSSLGLDPEKFEIMNLEPDTVICSITGHMEDEKEEEAVAVEGEEGTAAEGEEKEEGKE